MRSWCAIGVCGWLGLVAADGGAALIAAPAASPPLDIATVARGQATPRKPASKARPKIQARLPQAAVPAAPAGPPAAASEADSDDVTGTVESKKNARIAKPKTPPAATTDGTQFCSNIADVAADARLAWQMKELEKVEASLRERIVELEVKRAEYEKWLKLRQDFLKKAEDNVVGIYSRMRPDAAAAQIASMQDDTAAAVLAKLNVRSSSAILNEMEPARAAHLANTLSGLGRTDGEKDKNKK